MALTLALTIAGNPVSLTSGRVITNSWTINVDRPDEFEFTELNANLPGSFAPEQAVTLTVNGSLAFSGWIFSRHPSGAGSDQITVGYRCMSLKYKAYTVPITAEDGSGVMAFNLPTNDPNYASIFAGQSVGDILFTLFTLDAPALSPLGITADSTTQTQLAVLTIVPPDPVYLQGPSLWSQVDQLMQQWYGSRFAVTILPTGQIRLIDTFNLNSETLTFGQDPIVLNSMQEDTSECYTQVVVRGRDNVVPATVALSQGDLVDPNTVSEETWNLNDFLYPNGGFDQGAITAITATQVTIQSVNPHLSVPVNYWSGLEAGISLIDPLSNALEGYEFVRITANTAMAAGGTCVVTLANAIGSTSYTNYQIRGQNVGASNDYRQYVPTNQYVREHLVQYFPYAVNYGNNQSFAAQTQFPIATVTIENSGLPWQFSPPIQIVPFNGTSGGYVLFQAPVVTYFNSNQTLIQGGSAVQKPTDISIFLPYSIGALSVQSPAGGGFSGTAFTLFNCQRTLYRDYASWIDPNQASSMQALSDALLTTVSQALQEGQLTYYGAYLPALVPGSPISLSLAQFAGNPISSTTGYESMNAPCRSVTYEWPQQGASTITRIAFSTRRQAYSGDRLYLHANYQQGGGWFNAIGAGFSSEDTARFSAGYKGVASQLNGINQSKQVEAPNPGGFSPLESGDFSPIGDNEGFSPLSGNGGFTPLDDGSA